MASFLPQFPRFVFTILEPISLLAGFLSPILDTAYFVQSQLPSAFPTTTSAITVSDTARILALQLGNVYGLIGMIGVAVLYSSSEPKVVRNYLIACAMADVGHVFVSYAVMGQKDFLDVKGWNAMAWGNIGVTTGLFVTRVLYLTGALGADKVVESTKDAMKKKA
ncbi:hypothetical protein MMC21_002265 [Puttea exsequens]|nr:hypothetical protein [Puttea exsequens]